MIILFVLSIYSGALTTPDAPNLIVVGIQPILVARSYLPTADNEGSSLPASSGSRMLVVAGGSAGKRMGMSREQPPIVLIVFPGPKDRFAIVL